ncbi:hypothetical protein [Sphingobacterium sp. UDSM-2020]|uniref:hypothetical protein n=1 Tax=Sphingobacterium sp. UDSM-2020 TaxID=2795738 RepID=UPI001936D25E|nr:hypothetical protein [Sphingobacterium sp. UDSM-2020]QQD13407.1 hypothetical protein JAZ75_22915 [Sphingobacterium sp. UDSM-2020]
MESAVLKRTHERLYRVLLSKIAREASIVANRENRALAVSIQIVENGYVVGKFPDGSKRIIKELVRVKSKA